MSAAAIETSVASAAETIEVSVVMPCLNEARTVGRCVAKAMRALEDLAIAGEVIVADNGSSDGSQAIAREHGAKVVNITQRGYGSALQGGFAAARGQFIIMGDADDSYDFSRIEGFVDRLRAGDELVMGNRFRGGIRPGAMPPLHQYFGNPLLTALLKVFFGSPIGDCQCGLRGFRKEAVGRIKLSAPGMEFASEMVVKSCLNRLKISEVPVILHPDGRDRPPHMRSFRDGWRNLRLMLLLCPLWLYSIPAGLSLVLGLFLMLWLTPGTRHLGRVNLDVHTMLLGTLCVLLGYQTLWLGFLAQVYGHFSGVLPTSGLVQRLLRAFTLERGLLTGLAIFVVGLAANFWLVQEWVGRDMGQLDIPYTMRFALWGLTAMVAGVQTAYSSFFLSMLRMTRT
ncbi:MAG TPA: glycosyltransferase family 2 protein [Gemmataceae bacterium]|nr:glycosyltransferase family 2 protein [Gemmataceae bacterium]